MSAQACRSCRSTALDQVLDLGAQPMADDLAPSLARALEAPTSSLTLSVCPDCSLVQLGPGLIAPSTGVHGHGSAFSTTVSAHEEELAASLVRILGSSGGRVLDVHSGSGAVLGALIRAGAHALGWEDDPVLADRARASGVPTVGTPPVGLHDGSFDVVLANHSLSHEEDLDGSVAELARLLAPGGTLVVEFHSASAILLGGQIDIVTHAHRTYLTLGALQNTLERHGLTTVDATTSPLYGGVVRAAIRHRPAEAGSSVADVLAAESAAGVLDLQAWSRLTDTAQVIRQQFGALVDDVVEQGKSLAAYGASSRGTTLLTYCGITRAQIPRVADRNPEKQHRWLPTVGTEIVPPAALEADRPDVVVVLAWPLRREVLQQLSPLRDAGTQFLFPLPQPELLS